MVIGDWYEPASGVAHCGLSCHSLHCLLTHKQWLHALFVLPLSSHHFIARKYCTLVCSLFMLKYFFEILFIIGSDKLVDSNILLGIVQ